MTTRETILHLIRTIAEEQGKRLPPLQDELSLLDSGLDSLCIAILVARLEDELGLDPFSDSGPAVLPVTVGDWVRIYEHTPG